MAKKLVKTTTRKIGNGLMKLNFFEDTDDTLLPCGICGGWIPKGRLEDPSKGCPFKMVHHRILEGI